MKIAQQFFQLVGGSASECGMSMICPFEHSSYLQLDNIDWWSLRV